MAERCNCDASCGENRYHDLGSPGCRYEFKCFETPKTPIKSFAKENNMAKPSVKTKLNQVNENFTVNMYDNGYMVEVGGRDKKGEYKTSKLMLNSADELIEVIKEITSMERCE